uniref:E3 ubiquitin-protein ligase TRIP12 n=1 Tax=Trypanosoma congolense (strain IL3000) TaxID=1068625 RepID=G0UXG7_TRYCI|nr:unnamed protein product [Trypanosoma congolense IL3000]
MMNEDVSTSGQPRYKALVADLRNTINAYRNKKFSEAGQKVHATLEIICVALCFADESFIRGMNPSNMASALVAVLTSPIAEDFADVQCLAVRTIALFADTVPRGGFATVSAKGIQPLVVLLRDLDPFQLPNPVEELLKCLSILAFEAHEHLTQQNTFTIIVSLEKKVELHHLRLMCLRCLSHLLALASPEEWNTYFSKPCGSLMTTFHDLVARMVKDGWSDETMTKEDESYLLALLECVARMFDRVFRSSKIIERNSRVVEDMVLSLASVITGAAYMGPRGAALRDAACAPLLTLLFTDTPMMLKMFQKCHVLDSVYNTISELIGGKPKQTSFNGMAVISSLMEDDLTCVPMVAEEQKVLMLLEFLLVVTPPLPNTADSDYYITLPHHVWQWEDDFHNWSDCTEDLSKRLEGEYVRQRRSSDFSVYEVSNASSSLRIDFGCMKYRSAESAHYPHSISRRSSIAGYIYRRPTRCQCNSVDVSDPPLISTATSQRRDTGKVGHSTTLGSRCVDEAQGAISTGFRGVEAAQVGGTRGGRRRSTRSMSSGGVTQLSERRSSAACEEGEENSNCCMSVFRSLLCCLGADGRSSERDTENPPSVTAATFQEALDDIRMQLLLSEDTRRSFIRDRTVYHMIHEYIPILLRVVCSTANITITRHCSVLILRCVGLIILSFSGCLKPKSSNLPILRRKFLNLCPFIGATLTYLATASSTHETVTVPVTPFREFRCGHVFLAALSALGVSTTSRLPAMDLTCETQLNTLNALLALCSDRAFALKTLTSPQMVALLRKLEKDVGPMKRCSQEELDALHDLTITPPCPFHATSKQIEEMRMMLIRKLCAILHRITTRTTQCVETQKYDDALCCVEIPESYVKNPLSMQSSAELSFTMSIGSISDLFMPQEIGCGNPLLCDVSVIGRIHSIHECMKNHGDELPAFLYEQPTIFDGLASALRSSQFRETADSTINRTLGEVMKGLLRTICKITGIGKLEEPRSMERQYTRVQRRNRRNKAMLMIVDYMWSPLRVNLVYTPCVSRRVSSSKVLREHIDSAGREALDVANAQVTDLLLNILPTTPLSYIARYIVMQLNKQYNNVHEKQIHAASARRESTMAGNAHRGELLSSVTPYDVVEDADMDEAEELVDIGGTSTPPFRRGRSLPGNDVEDEDGSVSSPVSEFSESGDVEYLCEHILRTVSATVPAASKRSSGTSQLSLQDAFKSHKNSTTTYTITANDIVFYCRGKPVTDLSASVLDLCCSCYSHAAGWTDFMNTEGMVEEYDKTRGDGFSTGERLQNVTRNVLALWSSVHTISYSVVDGAFLRKYGEDNNVNVLRVNESSPKSVFARLSSSPKGTSFLWSAAELLNEMGHFMKNRDKSFVLSDDVFVSSVLFHEFYNHFGALMLPALTHGIIRNHVGSEECHFLSAILWSYPQVFSYEIRRTLLQLLFAVRRIHTPAIAKLKGLITASSPAAPAHGLEWLRPDLNMRGTCRVKVQRANILESGSRVLRRHAMCPLTLSVEFENELGVGAGPAVEFYNLLAKELQGKELRMWRTEEFTDASGNIHRRVQLPLFPAVCQTAESLSYFELLGLLVGRALMEERVVDIPLHECFLRGVLGEVCGENELHQIDPQLDQQLKRLLTLSPGDLEACGLTFVLHDNDLDCPGGFVELCSGGARTQVSAANVADYVKSARRYYCRVVPSDPVMYFLHGVRYAVNPYHLRLFSASELKLIISGPEGKVWKSAEDLWNNIIMNHGYDRNSSVVADFVDVVSGWDAPLQRAFLRFVTGSTRVPLGGLQPPITIVRRSVESVTEEAVSQSARGGDASGVASTRTLRSLVDASLPTVNTCMHYLKLPSYSSREKLEGKLKIAITEGQGVFALT